MVQRILVIAVIVLVFLAFLTTYTVRFNELAVVTTFGRAEETSVKTAGLWFKIPYVQQVTKYDARTRLIQSDQETQQTFDNSQIIVSSYLTWRVDKPLKFYRRFSGSGESSREHYVEAEKILKSKLRSAMSEVSKFRLDQLLASSDKGSKLPELEAQILSVLSRAGEGDASLSEYGVVPLGVGISGITLPQETSKQVFERMKAQRLKIANEAVSQGESQANTIRSSAQTDARKIASFADQLAKRIRTQGDIEAAAFLKQLNEDPRLAVFIQNMEFMRTAFGKTTTLVLPTSMPGFELFRPDALKTLKVGEIPAPDTGGLMSPQGDAASSNGKERP